MSTAHRYLLLFVAAMLAAFAGGCASTSITSAWRYESETFSPVTLRSAVAESVRTTSRATGEALEARG